MSARIDMKGKRFGWLRVMRVKPTKVKAGYLWKCECDCGKKLWVLGRNLRHKNTYSCGCYNKHRARETNLQNNNPNWKGGRSKRNRGYVDVLCDNGKYRKEHRLVMEKVLNRRLHNDETVHHKNGVRHDNRIENLELWVGRHPPGQRIGDLVQYAFELLERYHPTAYERIKDLNGVERNRDGAVPAKGVEFANAL